MDVNVFDVLRLFQATLPLLRAAATPKFVTIGSSAGSIESINEEEDHIIAFVIDPGWTQTDMGNTAARSVDLDEALVTVKDSCDGTFEVISEATRESGGKLWTYEGKRKAW
ncbi:hypothetical protein F4813DRAFT_401559 [Daldinia decipiens]|uniref:uncharacterized protein n=1 Tax=Daldinia decipiens TaxID=326647 RepID=UPI0020C380C0|nr:uncharacterized protein F4813DRAFT_401559 [Daldinia decipiens]KAI1659570.1 hypothetical protein F4813DRAFT_401559 [Daldinia decipiens]